MPKQDHQLRGDRLHDDDMMCNNMEELLLVLQIKKFTMRAGVALFFLDGCKQPEKIHNDCNDWAIHFLATLKNTHAPRL